MGGVFYFIVKEIEKGGFIKASTIRQKGGLQLGLQLGFLLQ
jgi:hypothetical protein